MGKQNNLGNIPFQKSMNNEQEQVYTNGINKGRKLEREETVKVLEELIEGYRSHKNETAVLILLQALDTLALKNEMKVA